MNLYLFDCFGVVVSDVSTLWMKAENFSDEQTAQARKLFRKVDCGEVSFEDSFDVLAKMCEKADRRCESGGIRCFIPLTTPSP